MEMTTERKRDGGIVAPAWWPAAASAAKRDRGLVNEQIAEKVAPLLDLESIDVSRVTRCLNGSTATIPLMDAISTVLGIPPPVYVAQTVDEAAALSLASTVARRRANALARADMMLDAAATEAADLANRQTNRVGSDNGGQDGRAQGGVGNRRRHARAS